MRIIHRLMSEEKANYPRTAKYLWEKCRNGKRSAEDPRDNVYVNPQKLAPQQATGSCFRYSKPYAANKSPMSSNSMNQKILATFIPMILFMPVFCGFSAQAQTFRTLYIF